MDEASYHNILRHYEQRFEEHGASAKGMDWPNEEDLARRFDVMLGLIRPGSPKPVSILDLACGIGLLADHIRAKGETDAYDYRGIDLSEKIIDKARELHPDRKFEVRDVLRNPLPERSVDYVIMNGLLTEKVSLSQEEMESFAQGMLKAAFAACRRGITFNVMSTHVDWTRPDLFHWPMDRAADFLVKNVSRSLVLRMDYGLYEYTVYAYREAKA